MDTMYRDLRRLRRLSILMLGLGLAMVVSSQVLALYLSYLFQVSQIYKGNVPLEAHSPKVIELNYTDIVRVRYNITFNTEKPIYVDIAFRGGEFNLVLETQSYLVTGENSTVQGELLVDGKLNSIEITLLTEVPNENGVGCELTLAYTTSPEVYYLWSILSALLALVGLGLFIYGVYYYLLLRRFPS